MARHRKLPPPVEKAFSELRALARKDANALAIMALVEALSARKYAR